MRRDYYPYGEELTAAGNDDTPYTFTQKELDSATGLHYFGARYYDRRIGRWLVPDALAQKHPEWSPYNYVLANPLRLIDPDGRQVDVHEVRFLRDQALRREGATDRDIAAFHRADAQVEAVGASSLTLLFAGSRAADALIGLAQDVVTGNLGLASLLNFVPGGDEIKKVGKGLRVVENLSKLPKLGVIDPSLVRFSQHSISSKFKNPEFGTVAELTEKLKSGKISVSEIAPIRVVEREGKIFTLDNRRLKAFQDAGIPIRFTRLDKIPENELFKFTTRNEGTSIIIRGQVK